MDVGWMSKFRGKAYYLLNNLNTSQNVGIKGGNPLLIEGQLRRKSGINSKHASTAQRLSSRHLMMTNPKGVICIMTRAQFDTKPDY